MHELPLIDDLVIAVQKCRREKTLGVAENLHSQIRELGLDTHGSIGNFIVPMFAECGSLENAQKAFDRLPHQNEHSWTSLISGYVEDGQIQLAIDLYEKMQRGDAFPSCYTLMAMLKAYARTSDAERGQEVHAQAVNSGYDLDVFIGSSLVHMYSKCGLVMDARHVFDSMEIQNTVSWTAIISGYAEHGPGDEALTCYEQMRSEGLALDGSILVCVLKACSNIGSLGKGREAHVDIICMGLDDDDTFIQNSLVDMYAKCGALEEAGRLSDKLPARSLMSWTVLIAGYAEHGPGEKALECFECMKAESISPDALTFVSVLKACGSIGAVEKGRHIHQNIPKSDLEQFFFVGNAIVDMYVKCGALEEAQEIFGKLRQRACLPWNALIAGYAERGASEQVLKCVWHMEQEGAFADAGTYVSVLKACGSTGSVDEARKLHADVVIKGFEGDLSVSNTLIDIYAKKGPVAAAHYVFNKLISRDVVSWTALISGYADAGQGELALDCLAQMQRERIAPNCVTLVCALKSCGSVGAFVKGLEIHGEAARKGFETDDSLSNTLIDVYGKSGSLSEAERVFARLPEQDLVSWNAMIKAYGWNRDGEMAVHRFHEMLAQGIKPDEVTFTCVLFACSRAKLLHEGRELFNMMRERYGIRPCLDHFTCIVDLHAKAGCLSDVVDGFLGANASPSLWMALLTACKVHGEVNLGHRCFERLLQMDPKVAAPYVLMAKTYEGAGMWEDARRIEELRKLSGEPAAAFIGRSKERAE